jgi:hypothetical protein
MMQHAQYLAYSAHNAYLQRSSGSLWLDHSGTGRLLPFTSSGVILADYEPNTLVI